MATPTPRQGPPQQHAAKKNKKEASPAPESTKKRRKTDSSDTTISDIGNGGTKRRVTPWSEWFEKLLQYKEENGDCLVPKHYCKDGKKLGRWVSNQRQKLKKNGLSPLQREKLEAIGFKFSLKDRYDTFDTMYERLLQYKQKHGDCLVPQKYDQKLHGWVLYIRQRKKKDKLPEDRVTRLENIGFVWEERPRKQRTNGSGGVLNKPEKDTNTSEDKWANYTVEDFSDEDVI